MADRLTDLNTTKGADFGSFFLFFLLSLLSFFLHPATTVGAGVGDASGCGCGCGGGGGTPLSNAPAFLAAKKVYERIMVSTSRSRGS